MAQNLIAVCGRCLGTGRYDRGACFGCRSFGACGWVRVSKPSKSFVQVTTIRDQAEGRIDWIKVYGPVRKDTAVEIVKRQMRVSGKPNWLIESVAA